MRVEKRSNAFLAARRAADAKGKPLVVVGAPDRGMTGGYPCGDITVDLAGSSCPHTMALDVTQPLPWKDDSVVVLVSYVLEYAADQGTFDRAMKELHRVSGGDLWVLRVEPWTLTSILYPGTKMQLPSQWQGVPIL